VNFLLFCVIESAYDKLVWCFHKSGKCSALVGQLSKLNSN
jgi:hypothetical protein